MAPRALPTLTDGRVILRPPDERDVIAIEAGIRDPDVVRWFGHQDLSGQDVLAQNRRRWAEGSPTFAICDEDDTCIGHAWLNLSRTDAATASVGYWLLPGARGRGTATRAVGLLVGWGTRELGLRRIRLLTETGNEASQRVAERSGFQRVGIVPASGEIDGRAVDQVLYELEPATSSSMRRRT